MKKVKYDLSLKNSILIVLSALSLVFASFCWFTLDARNNVDSIDADVGTLSSNYVFYQAVDANKNGVVDNGETYVEIQTSSISTQYMIPGEKYFYKAVITNSSSGVNFAFIFNNISFTSGFDQKVMVTTSLVRASNSTTVAQNSTERTIAYYSQTDVNDVTDATVLTATSLSSGTYELYYTLKIDNSTSNSFEGATLTINDVLVEFFTA